MFVLCLVSLLGIFTTTPAQPAQVAMSPDNWRTSEPKAKFENYLNRQSLYLESGTALVKNSKFEDGTLEVDISSPNPRVFAGVVFRALSSDESEVVYVRLHKNGLPDAIQYTPRFRGIDCWQLYNRGYTAAAGFKRDGWTRLKIEVEGRTARIYVNEAEKPHLVVEDLKRDEGEGEVGVMALGGVYMSNFSYTPHPRTASLVKKKDEFMPGTIVRFDVSQAFAASNVNLETYPTSQQLSSIKWESLNAETPGFLNISRFRSKQRIDNAAFNSEDVVFVKKTIVSTKPQIKKLSFGYSDRAAIYLNGKIIFSGNYTFLSRDSQFLGAIGLSDSVYLDLKQGENELLFVVLDRVGGWGVQAQFEDTREINFE